MIVIDNTLYTIEPNDVIDGVFTAPDDVLYIGDCLYCDDVVKMVLPNVKKVGNSFLQENKKLEYLEMPNVVEIGNYFLQNNVSLKHLTLPKVEYIGVDFLYKNKTLIDINMPNIKEIRSWFMYCSSKFNYTPKIIKATKGHLYIDCKIVDKLEKLRKVKIKKILC